ncbi:Gtp-binding protein 1, partial [Globisporangium splendens]
MVASHDHSLDASTRDWLREVRVRGGQMLQLHRSFQTMSCTFQQLAESSHLYQLAETLTKESRTLLSAEQALVFIVDTAEQEFWCRVPRSSDAKEMVTVRSKLMPFATAGHTHAQPPVPTGADAATRPTPGVETPPMARLSAGGQPSGLASMVYHTKRPLMLPAGHVTKHPYYSTASDNTDRMISHPSASTLLVPIVYRGRALGVIQLCGKTTVIEALGLSIALEKCDAFTHEYQALLMLLVHFASGLFPKVSYFTEVESNKVNEETLIQLAPEISTCLRFEELGKIVIQNAKEILDANRCLLFVADNAERTLHNWQSDISGGTVQVYENTKKSGMTIPFGRGIVGLVAETWQVINIPDAYEDPRFNSSWGKKTNYRTKSMLAVPTLTNTTKRQPIRRASHFAAAGNDSGLPPTPQQGAQSQEPQTEQTLLGVIQVINKSGGAPFRAKDVFLLKTITKLIALAIENSQPFQENQELCSNLGKLLANGDLVETVISLGTSAEDIIGVECAAIYVYDHLAQEIVTFHRKRRHKIVVKEQMYRHSLFGDAVASKELTASGINAHNLLFAPLVVDDPDAIGVGGGTRLVGLTHLVNTKGRKLKFEPTQEKTKPETEDERRGFGASSFRKYTLRVTASDEKIGFIKHAVVACPVDLSAISARSKKLQSMLELSMRKPEIAMSLTLSARGQLVTFLQPLNVVTLASCVHAATALNISIRSLSMDENGNRWGFQLSAAGIHEMHAEHFLKWIGKDLTASQVFDKLRTDLQSAYVPKEAVTGEIDRKSTEVREHVSSESHTSHVGGDGQRHTTRRPPSAAQTTQTSNALSSLPQEVIYEIRKLLWDFVDTSWKVDIKRACKMFDPVDPSRQRYVSRDQLEQTLSSSGGRNVQLDRLHWDLLHTQFADPHTDLVNVERIFQTLAPQIIAVAHFQYEIVPILDPITQSIVSIHVILMAM